MAAKRDVRLFEEFHEGVDRHGLQPFNGAVIAKGDNVLLHFKERLHEDAITSENAGVFLKMGLVNVDKVVDGGDFLERVGDNLFGSLDFLEFFVQGDAHLPEHLNYDLRLPLFLFALFPLFPLFLLFCFCRYCRCCCFCCFPFRLDEPHQPQDDKGDILGNSHATEFQGYTLTALFLYHHRILLFVDAQDCIGRPFCALLVDTLKDLSDPKILLLDKCVIQVLFENDCFCDTVLWKKVVLLGARKGNEGIGEAHGENADALCAAIVNEAHDLAVLF